MNEKYNTLEEEILGLLGSLTEQQKREVLVGALSKIGKEADGYYRTDTNEYTQKLFDLSYNMRVGSFREIGRTIQLSPIFLLKVRKTNAVQNDLGVLTLRDKGEVDAAKMLRGI